MRSIFRIGLFLGFMIGGGAGASAASSTKDPLCAILIGIGIIFAMILDRSMKE